jgi:RNA polymerase sigma-70 factor (ECF subfamily)
MAPAGDSSQSGAQALRDQIGTLHAAAYGWALTCCRRDRHEAEEVLQDSDAKVMSGRAKFDGRSRFKTWFFGVIRRTAMERRRRSLMRKLSFRQYQGESSPSVPSAPDDAVSKAARAAAVADALPALAVRQREVLHLVFYEGLSVGEAAGAMGVSLGTARLHYHRGKKRLLKLLDERRFVHG